MKQASIFKWQQWILPIFIGIGAATAVIWFMAQRTVIDPDTGAEMNSLDLLFSFEWTRRSTWAMMGLIACVVLRDLGYIHRLKTLSFQSFTWRQATQNIFLWELASALTPSVVGGSAIAVVILKRDGLRWGKSLATVFATALLDEAFYLILVPIVFGISAVSGHPVFPEWPPDFAGISMGVSTIFWIAYSVIAGFTTLMLFGLIIRPKTTNKFILRASETWALRRWKDRMKNWASDLLEASVNIRKAPRNYWIKGFGATCVSWTARFLTLNMVLLIFYPSLSHAAVFARQLVLWVVLTISPSPGSSGAAEFGLPLFLSDITGLAYITGVVILWRMATYFLYLVLGALVLPQWLVRTNSRKKNPS
ncbi:MAG: lysylphosphatidylglycerol synthase transmembrane domain-containing protein [Bacteroidetes bacterium]|nr:lysylphosphatidylglycerol synthase transmembrane domain-containing protein [Bacteroidota bacterium]